MELGSFESHRVSGCGSWAPLSFKFGIPSNLTPGATGVRIQFVFGCLSVLFHI